MKIQEWQRDIQSIQLANKPHPHLNVGQFAQWWDQFSGDRSHQWSSRCRNTLSIPSRLHWVPELDMMQHWLRLSHSLVCHEKASTHFFEETLHHQPHFSLTGLDSYQVVSVQITLTDQSILMNEAVSRKENILEDPEAVCVCIYLPVHVYLSYLSVCACVWACACVLCLCVCVRVCGGGMCKLWLLAATSLKQQLRSQ